MAPKRASSPKPKAGAKSKAKAEAKEDPQKKIDEEAAAEFERFEPEGKRDGVLKLKEFADLIRALNSKKCMIWGDDPGKVIRDEWKSCGGNVSKELKFEEFKAWWVPFKEQVDKEFEEKREAEAAAETAKSKEKDEKYGHDGIWRIKFKELKEAIEESYKKGKTPLIIDNTEGFKTDAYFTYSNAYVLETKKWIMAKATEKKSPDEIFEEERNRWFNGGKCFKYGSTVMFRLANSAPDLKNTFNTEQFPTLALLDCNQVKNIIGLDNAKNVKESPFYKMPPDKDSQMEFEFEGAKEGFMVVAVTQFDEGDYVEFLEKMIPLELMQPIKPETD